VVRSQGGSFVFVQKAEGFEAVPVEVVAQGPEGTVLRGALQPGSQVVAEGTAALKAVWLGGGE
jgi:multidrug efflux pump subunit AcrA (membrane-fusion protein)